MTQAEGEPVLLTHHMYRQRRDLARGRSAVVQRVRKCKYVVVQRSDNHDLTTNADVDRQTKARSGMSSCLVRLPEPLGIEAFEDFEVKTGRPLPDVWALCVTSTDLTERKTEIWRPVQSGGT